MINSLIAALRTRQNWMAEQTTFSTIVDVKQTITKQDLRHDPLEDEFESLCRLRRRATKPTIIWYWSYGIWYQWSAWTSSPYYPHDTTIQHFYSSVSNNCQHEKESADAVSSLSLAVTLMMPFVSQADAAALSESHGPSLPGISFIPLFQPYAKQWHRIHIFMALFCFATREQRVQFIDKKEALQHLKVKATISCNLKSYGVKVNVFFRLRVCPHR